MVCERFLKDVRGIPFQSFNTRTGLDCGGLRGFLTSISHRRLNTLNMTIEQFSSSNPGAQLLWRAADVQQLAVERRWPDDRKLCPSGHAEAAHKKHVAKQPDLHARCYTSGSVRSTLHESSHTLSCQQLCPDPPPLPAPLNPRIASASCIARAVVLFLESSDSACQARISDSTSSHGAQKPNPGCLV